MSRYIRSDGVIFAPVTVHIEEDLKKEAQEQGINLTETFREALKEKMQIPEGVRS